MLSMPCMTAMFSCWKIFASTRRRRHNDPAFSQETGRDSAICTSTMPFGTAHRAHASTRRESPGTWNRCAAGYLLKKEIDYLGSALETPERPVCRHFGRRKDLR